METPPLQSIVTTIQKLMQQKGFSTKAQWDELTMMPSKVLSKTAFLEHLSSYGLDLTNDEIALLWDHFNLRPHSINFNDFEKIMKATFPPPTQNNYPATVNFNDYGQSRPSTAANQRSSPNRQSYQQYPQRERSMDTQEEQQFQQRPSTTQTGSRYIDDQGRHSYYSSRSIQEREKQTMPLSDFRAFDSLSNTSIQRDNFDGPNSSRKSFRTKTSLKKTLAIISDAASACDPSSWSCFLRWRDPTKDTIDASDLLTALQRDANVRLNLADVQKVIDKYGPLTQNTFKLMLTEGHRYSLSKDFSDDDY